MAAANIAVSTFTSSAVVVYLMQRLKQAKWFPYLQEGQGMILRLVSIGGAALSAIAVSYVWDPTARTLLINVPTLMGVAVALWHWLNHYAIQETIYQATTPKPELKP